MQKKITTRKENIKSEDHNNIDEAKRSFIKKNFFIAAFYTICSNFRLNKLIASSESPEKKTIDLSQMKEGEIKKIIWNKKVVFIKKRTSKQILEDEKVEITSLIDPEPVAQNNKNYTVVIGICTHLGCIPMSNEGKFDGWLCPCHSSHFDSLGRVRTGPARKNLQSPPHKFVDSKTLIIG